MQVSDKHHCISLIVCVVAYEPQLSFIVAMSNQNGAMHVAHTNVANNALHCQQWHGKHRA